MEKTKTSTIEFSFLERFLEKKCNVKLMTGQTFIGVVKAVSAYEIMLEEAAGKPQKMIFKHAIQHVKLRL